MDAALEGHIHWPRRRRLAVTYTSSTRRGARALIGEILGVYHAKACVFDDATLLTGANLSEEYFRRARTATSSCAISKVRTGTTAPCARPPPRRTRQNGRGRSASSARDPPPAPPPRRRRFHRSRRRPAATLFPTAQVRDILDLDARALSAVLDASPRCGLSTAYANPPPAVVEALGRTAATVVVPAPDTHGFAGATGAKAFLPLAHARFAWDLATKLKGSGDVRAWAAPRETYHAKGLLGVFGGRRAARRRHGRRVLELNVRSHRRDVELGAALVVRDGALRRRLGDEWRRLRGRRARSGVGAAGLGRRCCVFFAALCLVWRARELRRTICGLKTHARAVGDPVARAFCGWAAALAMRRSLCRKLVQVLAARIWDRSERMFRVAGRSIFFFL